MKNSLNCSKGLLDLSTAIVMGILNLTPDSFHDGGKNLPDENYLKLSSTMLEQGAKIIDIGGQSTRPGATFLSAEEEWSRIQYPLFKLIKEFPDAIFSIDTFYSLVAQRAIEAGVSVVNDVSAGSIDPNMFATVAKLRVPYVLMHMQGNPRTMQIAPEYEDVMLEILDFFILKS